MSDTQISTEVHDPDEAYIEASRAPLMEHLIELRSRLIYMVVAFILAFIVCYVYVDKVLDFLLHPYSMANQIYSVQKTPGAHPGPFDLIFVLLGIKKVAIGMAPPMISTAALETFFTKIKIAMFAAIILSFPVLAYQLYAFVAPGLYKRERLAFLPFLLAAPILFLMGACLVYFLILPMVLWFSLNQQVIGTVSIRFTPKISEYLDLVTSLILAFGACFQLPIVITLLGMTGIVNAHMLTQFRKYAIFAAFVVAAVITPPDPISQITLAVPVVLLYEVSILCVRILEWRRKP